MTTYWKDPARREPGEGDRDEFVDVPWPGAAAPSRRTFLKAAGFTAFGALASSCARAPVERAIPYLIKPEEITPGRALFYASTCSGCSAGCGLLVKTRDGRPIKLEGNPDHPLSRGAACAVGQASILGLYDSQRLTAPLGRGKPSSWAEVDRDIIAQLDRIRQDGGAVRVLTGTIISPTTRAAIDRFVASFPHASHVEYDALSASSILEAHARTHGARVLPRYRFDRAAVIASFDADFLGTWLSPVEFAGAYADRRRPDGASPSMSYHVQIESRMSLTGGKADRRLRVAPHEQPALLTALAARLADRAGVSFAGGDTAPLTAVHAAAVDDLAARLWTARGRALVVSGAPDVDSQILCNFANELLGSYGTTVDVERPSYQRAGSDRSLTLLGDELRGGKVAALVVAGVNPAYDLAGSAGFVRDAAKVPLVVSVADHLDETAALAHFVCPEPHALEAWGDAEPVAGVVSLVQPSIRPFGDTRTLAETLSRWIGDARPARELVRAHWHEHIYPRANTAAAFDEFWDAALERGAADVTPAPPALHAFDRTVVRPVSAPPPPAGGLALVLYPKVSMLDGRHAHNPWLQELPDPISKVTWDNYAALSPATAARLGVSDGDIVRLDPASQAGGARAIELPAFVQPGQHDGVVAVALGYGRKGTERFARVGPQWLEGRPTGGDDGIVGKNAMLLVPASVQAGADTGPAEGGHYVQMTRTGRTRALASTQSHHTLVAPAKLSAGGAEPRPIVQELTLAALAARAAAGGAHEGGGEDHPQLWPADHPYTGHRWGLAIDLAACTGCAACVAACQVENNVPVVGQDEVRRHREMHWIRIDRYYSGESAEVDLVHQPMLCQHCENAPCETVCPVLATAHSDEGLNEQVYNRCVGTRYCANNCPYKVRRFNWFDYPHEDRLQNLVLNPDVTVRSRGVMEKCSLCIQRIQEARMEARRLGRPIADGDIRTACQQTCPTQAIVFGDLNDPGSRVSALVQGGRGYHVLEELNVKPVVTYLKVVRNRPEPTEGSHV